MEKHLLAIAIIALSTKQEGDIQQIANDLFDDAFMAAEDYEKDVLSAAFTKPDYAVEHALALLKGGIDGI